MGPARAFPLDLERTGYSYIERPNRVLLGLLERYVLRGQPDARVLDVGCGAGANARDLRLRWPKVHITGIEPNAHAASLAEAACDEVFQGTAEDWLRSAAHDPYQAVVLSDVLEHIPDPVALLRRLREVEALRRATWVISVPNYAVWYNRVRTLAGRFEYAWSGLYDRTHLRFFTRGSIRRLLEYAGFSIVGDGCTPSLAQAMAPVLRTFYEKDVAEGDHLSLQESHAYRVYETAVEPVETKVCQAWPELLGFQIVTVARSAG